MCDHGDLWSLNMATSSVLLWLLSVYYSGDMQCVTMANCCVLPWGAACIGITVAADGSWFVDFGAEHPVNHFPIGLPPTAKPCVLFPWQQYNSSN